MQGVLHVPTNETRETVKQASGLGLPHKMIAPLVGLSDRETLTKHYQVELDLGAALAGQKVAGYLMEKIEAGDTASIMFYCKTRLGFKEQTEDTSTDLVGVLSKLMDKLPG